MVDPKHTTVKRKRLPPYVKGLMDRRARADGRYRQLMPDLEASLQLLAKARAVVEDLQKQVSGVHAKRDACDDLLKAWHSAIDTDAIAPVQAWKERYGERGTLKQAMLDYLRAAGHEGIKTAELVDLLAAKFGITFLTPTHRNEWRMCSVANALRDYLARGLVERAPSSTRSATVWRMPVHTPESLDTLAQQAASAGLGVTSATAPTSNAKPGRKKR